VYRQWDWIADINGDGLITISDTWKWISWLYYYPGDYLIKFLSTNKSSFATFFEISPVDYGGTFSFLVSAIVWGFSLLMVFGIALAVNEATIVIPQSIKDFFNPSIRMKRKGERSDRREKKLKERERKKWQEKVIKERLKNKSEGQESEEKHEDDSGTK